jgi:hypothetical protein
VTDLYTCGRRRRAALDGPRRARHLGCAPSSSTSRSRTYKGRRVATSSQPGRFAVGHRSGHDVTRLPLGRLPTEVLGRVEQQAGAGRTRGGGSRGLKLTAETGDGGSWAVSRTTTSTSASSSSRWRDLLVASAAPMVDITPPAARTGPPPRSTARSSAARPPADPSSSRVAKRSRRPWADCDKARSLRSSVSQLQSAVKKKLREDWPVN